MASATLRFKPGSAHKVSDQARLPCMSTLPWAKVDVRGRAPQSMLSDESQLLCSSAGFWTRYGDAAMRRPS